MQHMPEGVDAPADPQLNNTFGGFLSSGTDGPALVATGPMQLTSATESSRQMLSVAGLAGSYSEEDAFLQELKAQVAQPADKAAHAAVWHAFWNSADINITAAALPANPTVAAAASRVTLLDRVNRAAFHSMSMGKHAIKFNAYGIYAAYPEGQEDYRVWGQ